MNIGIVDNDFTGNQRGLCDIIVSAKAGNNDDMLALLERYEPLINKFAKRGNRLDPDMKQHLSTEFLHIVKSFDPTRYIPEKK